MNRNIGIELRFVDGPKRSSPALVGWDDHLMVTGCYVEEVI